MPETFATLVKVPAVSKKSMKNRVKITVTIEADNAAPKSNANKCVIGGGEDITPLNWPRPVTQAIALKATIPIIMFPLIFIFSITIIDINAPAPKRSKGLLRSPNVTRVTGWSAVSPIISKPITPKNKPIPAPIPSFKLFGIELISQALIGVSAVSYTHLTLPTKRIV